MAYSVDCIFSVGIIFCWNDGKWDYYLEIEKNIIERFEVHHLLKFIDKFIIVSALILYSSY
jgi:hypothetical protein